MILTLVDTMANSRAAASSLGTAVPSQSPDGKPSASFKNAVNTLIGQVGGEAAQGQTTPIDKLVARLSKILQTLENIDLDNNPALQIETAVEQISSALVDFAAATGIDLVSKLSPAYASPADTVAGEIILQAVGESPASDISGLITFVDLVTQLSTLIEGASEIPSGLKQQFNLGAALAGQNGLSPNAVQSALDQAPLDQVPANLKAIQLNLDEGTLEQPRLTQQIAQITQPRDEVVEIARVAAQPAASTLPGLAIQAEGAVNSVQAGAQVRSTVKTSAIGDSQSSSPTNPIDLQVAMAFAQKGSEKGWSAAELFKSTFEFVSNVSNGQLTLQNPGVGLLSVVEPRFADLLPFDRPFWTSGTSIDMTTPAQSGDASTPKSSRFAAAIVDQIRTANVADGQTRIELSPRGLGNIEIEVTTDGDGATNVVIRADNSVVLNALREMRDPWVQITGMENNATFSFEDMSSQQDNSGGDNAGNTADDGSASIFETGQSIESAATAIIEGDQLDLIT